MRVKQVKFADLGRKWVQIPSTATDLGGKELWVRRGRMDFAMPVDEREESPGVTLEYGLANETEFLCRLVYGTDRKTWATVYYIETNPKYRRQGWATMLLKEWKTEMGHLERDAAFWCPMNEAAEKLAKKVGLRIV